MDQCLQDQRCSSLMNLEMKMQWMVVSMQSSLKKQVLLVRMPSYQMF